VIAAAGQPAALYVAGNPPRAEIAMATYGGITFTGKSGEKYFFHAWPLETRFRAIAAVYFVTKRGFSHKTYRIATHEGIYIGQTGNLTDPFATQLHLDCFKKYGANCVCVHVVEDEQRRGAVEQDMMAAHNTTCNELQSTRRTSYVHDTY
jgi:hypothetical protein